MWAYGDLIILYPKPYSIYLRGDNRVLQKLGVLVFGMPRMSMMTFGVMGEHKNSQRETRLNGHPGHKSLYNATLQNFNANFRIIDTSPLCSQL